MAGSSQRGGGQGGLQGLGLPAAGGGRTRRAARRHPEVERHAEEIRALARGHDLVEAAAAQEKRPAAFDRKALVVVRSWMNRRPLEPTPAAATIEPPRSWGSKRGRYCEIEAPGAGLYGIMRARPTF